MTTSDSAPAPRQRILKVMQGVVVSDKMDKTVVVSVETRKPHPLYKRIVRTTKRYKAHDEHNECKTGDVVRIRQSRPLSKEKRWRVIEILREGKVPEVKPIEASQADVAIEGESEEA